MQSILVLMVKPPVSSRHGPGAPDRRRSARARRHPTLGAAIIARENYVQDTESSILKPEEMDSFSVHNAHTRCMGCENKCMLTISRFNDGSRFVTGNRCERGEGKETSKSPLPDLYDYKFHRLFGYIPLSEETSTRGTIGIPRVLNMYENYPFWFTFFTKLGFRVVLSPTSTKEMYEKGIKTKIGRAHV